jgi:hypothetical protein
MVAGSNPARGANHFKRLVDMPGSGKIAGALPFVFCHRLLRGLPGTGFQSAWAFPVDEVALIVGFSGDLAGSPPRNDRRRGLTGKMGPWIGSA